MESKPRNSREETIEWVVALFSAAIVLALTGFIVFEALTKTGQHPDISLRTGSVYAMGHGFGIDVTVINDGHVAVADLALEARLAGADGAEEISTVTLDYLAAESTSVVGFGFSEAPDPDRVTIRVLGYIYP